MFFECENVKDKLRGIFLLRKVKWVLPIIQFHYLLYYITDCFQKDMEISEAVQLPFLSLSQTLNIFLGYIPTSFSSRLGTEYVGYNCAVLLFGIFPLIVFRNPSNYCP